MFHGLSSFPVFPSCGSGVTEGSLTCRYVIFLESFNTMQRRLGLAFATGLMQLVSTVYSVELPCYRRYFGTQGRNQDVIKWEEQMTEL